MQTLGNAILGLIFFGLALAGTLLMFKLWAYPFDEVRLRSSAPPSLMRLHRAIGYAYFVIYVYLMSQMVPRLWAYQVELPARTVAHMLLGMSIGVILLVKVSIVRFFKHLEGTMVPFLGTGLLICTFLLVGLSVPYALRETYMSRRVAGGSVFAQQNLERVKNLLPGAGFPEGTPIGALASPELLNQGRSVLLSKCVVCHDLRTVLAKPRTPENWVQTVSRMAERTVVEPISDEEQWRVAAYLIAISPELQRAVVERRKLDLMAEKARQEAAPVVGPGAAAAEGEAEGMELDLPEAMAVFERTCTQCHELENVENAPPRSAEEARELVARMVGNGLEAPQEDLRRVIYYLIRTYAKE